MKSDDDFDPNAISEVGDIEEPIRFDDFYALGLDPTKSTRASPGTEEKVLMLSARYAAGLSLWDARDRRDYGPEERDLTGADDEIPQQPLRLPEPDEHG
jgi:hypothetical protein